MFLNHILRSKKVITSIAFISIVSLALTFLPLIGTLGYEYSLVTAFVISFISVFISAEYISIDLKSHYPNNRRYYDLISNCFLLNFTILLFPFFIGLISSLIKSDCNLWEGLIFFLLITTVTVMFTSSLGLLMGNLFPKRGFFISSIIILIIIFYSLWILYIDPPLFSLNHIFGYFPGPLYDQVIPIDQNLVIFRLTTICWGALFLLALKLFHEYKYKRVGSGTALLSLFFMLLVAGSIIFSNELGFRHTREYLIDNYFTDSYETENFTIYFFPGSVVSNNVDLIAFDHEFRYAQLSGYLNIRGVDKITSFIYPDEITRKKLIGAGNTTIANPIHKEIHLIYDTFPNPLLKHELTHVLSSDFGSGIMKISPKIGLVEGLAVAADWDEVEGFNLHHWSRSILEMHSTINIKDIIGWAFWTAPASTSYTLTGSFVRYLIDEYGIEKYKQVYKTGNFELYGSNLETLISDWEHYLQQFDTTNVMPSITRRIYGRPSIFNDKCPRKSSYYSDLGVEEFEKLNFYLASKHFNKALSYNPDNNYILESLAYSYFYNRNYDYLRQILDSKKDIPDISRNIIRNLIGNVMMVNGDGAGAANIFEELKLSVLPLDISNEIDIKVDSLDYDNDLGKAITEYYSNKDNIKRVSILESLIRNYPEYPVPYYLLGKLFFYQWDFERSLVYLKQSERIGMPSVNLDLDNERLLGTSLFIAGEYATSAIIFNKIINLEDGGRYYNLASDFLERIDWIKRKSEELK